MNAPTVLKTIPSAISAPRCAAAPLQRLRAAHFEESPVRWAAVAIGIASGADGELIEFNGFSKAF